MIHIAAAVPAIKAARIAMRSRLKLRNTSQARIVLTGKVHFERERDDARGVGLDAEDVRSPVEDPRLPESLGQGRDCLELAGASVNLNVLPGLLQRREPQIV